MNTFKTVLLVMLSFTSLINANFVYITDGSSMKLIDVTTPSSPELKSTITTSSSFIVEVVDDTAYVAEFSQLDNDYLKIIDVSDTLAPTLISAITRLSPLLRVSDMQESSALMYLGDEYSGMHSLDLINASVTQDIFGDYDVMSMTLMNGDLYVINADPSGSPEQLQRLDISSPNAPSVLLSNTFDIDAKSYPTEESTHHSWVRNDGTSIYVANLNDKKLKKFDAQSLSLTSSVDIGGYPTAFAIEGQYAYVTMHAHDLESSMQISDDAIKMINLNTMTITDSKILTDASGVATHDIYTYVTDATGLHIYDTSLGLLSLVSDFADGSGNYIAIQATDSNETNITLPPSTDSNETNITVPPSGGGCGCSHDPSAGFDVMFFLILAIAFIFPWRKRLIKL